VSGQDRVRSVVGFQNLDGYLLHKYNKLIYAQSCLDNGKAAFLEDLHPKGKRRFRLKFILGGGKCGRHFLASGCAVYDKTMTPARHDGTSAVSEALRFPGPFHDMARGSLSLALVGIVRAEILRSP
jgi:hypothetical protein